MIRADLKEEIDETSVPFVNLNAMALMGMAVLHKDGVLFSLAYELFTGISATENLISEVSIGGRFIIKAFPRIIRFNINDIDRDKRLKELFAVAA